MTAMNDILHLPAPKADCRLAYGSDIHQFLDLRVPAVNGPHPLLMNIHGGFWREKYDLEHNGFLCAALAARGVATANVEYRRVGNPGGGWPGTLEDLRAAYRFLLENLGRYDIDAARSIIMGHSAGGQLALCLAACEKNVKAVVSLAGVVDLQQAYALHLSNDAVVEFLGGTPNQIPTIYREADPMQLTLTVEQWLVHGSGDDVVPVDFSRNYVETKKTAGKGAQLIEIGGAGHFDLIDPRTAAWKEVERVVLRAAA
ncbi:MAG TPA: alpha/beta hydrolase [Candidatus Aquilonibacter sp.]|nr:alpha/beta hydrolase [Candidatus Aquilonibacter sp.]